MKRTLGAVAGAAVVALALSGCGTQAEAGDGESTLKGDAASAVCDAVDVGAITRCENFYDDYWPEIDTQLDALYEQAKKEDGGTLVIWDWYELSPDVIAQFNERFPDITVETRGLTYNLSSAIISAKATGSRNTDVVSGSITSMAAMYDEGFWEKVDWASFGVPEEYLTIGAPELMPDSINGSLLQYNTDKVAAVPETLDGLLAPEYEGKVSVAGYNAVVFAGYGMAEGEDAMLSLIDELLSSGTMKLLEDQGAPLSSGDVPVALNQTLFNPNPSLQVAPFEHSGVWAQFSGVNSDAKNKPGAALWTLWNAFDPDWITLRMTDERFASTQVPFAGLPAATFAEATGLMKTNADALLLGLDSGAETETQDTRDDWQAMINAADKALNG
ncbi:ABC transporter substrate-binding protein [Microbacterium sp. p3-SID336]|uniref:ABC transporter substrate-binding protein n=1 Tax=Microbacterium sp. p3-SID336 TaxID=2916212 RepID=UPI0021A90EDE|nr:ABC transporter substrate-binding protein [Microbacterium sp. p3-SID336]MCT1477899.1 ABC transporter substrate-binding protein [Microbacterium sp. p3-SID336]